MIDPNISRRSSSNIVRRAPGPHPCRLLALRCLAAASLLVSTSLPAGTTPELVMHWSMEPGLEDIGEFRSDAPGGSATLVGFPGDGSEWQLGVLGRALVFDGVDQHLSYESALPRTQGTIGHWLRPSTSGGTHVALYESDFSGAATPDYNGFGAAGEALEIHTGIFEGDYYAVWQDGGVEDRREVRGGSVTPTAWSHVALTWRIPGQMKLYVNCVEVDSVPMDAAFDARAPTETFLGKPSQFGGRHWPGTIDEVKVWDREFSATAVDNHFCPRRQTETDVLFATTPTETDRFGASLALSGDWLLVRAPGAPEVSFYRRRGLFGFQFHSARPAAFTDGLSGNPEMPKPLDVAGTLAAVANAGGVDVYELQGAAPGSWNLLTTLTAPAAENFGYSISVSGDRIAVGAPSSGGGGVFVFERDQGGVAAWGGTFADTVTSTEILYGRFVDLDGDLLAAYSRSGGLLGTMDSVALFRRGEMGGIPGWAPEADFDAGSDVNEIISLAVRGDRIAAGIIESAGPDQAIVVRSRDQGGADVWGTEHILIASDADNADRLGANLAWLDNDRLAAAALATNRDHQSIYVFTMGGSLLLDQEMLLLQKTFDPLTSAGATLGRSLAGEGDLIVAGAPFAGFSIVQPPIQPVLSGRVHLFHLLALFADRFESPTP